MKRSDFARLLGLSYTFVRCLERGERFPSDEVLLLLSQKLSLELDEIAIAAYCDRSRHLTSALQRRGVVADAEVSTANEPQSLCASE
jgi:transcriptional regulator with XRE-family HTH domain